MISKQKAFDIDLTHLRKQGKQSRDRIRCKYRTYDGLKCAIGALIPDESYRPEFDQNNVRFADILSTFGAPKADSDFYSNMQWYLHDAFDICHHNNFLVFLEEMANQFAATHGLVYNT